MLLDTANSQPKSGGRRIRGILLPPLLLLWIGLVCLPATAASVFTPEERHQALEAAREYVSVRYQYNGQERQGVAYLSGGQDTVADYLEKVKQGAEPGKKAGIDASGLVINAYKTVYPQLQFISRTPEGKKVMVRDASSEILYLWNIEPAAPEDLKPGDLIFFRSPQGRINGVALYSGRQGNYIRIIVASYRKGKVIETGIRINGEYWNERVAGAGRLLKR